MGSLPPEALTVLVGLVLLVPTINGILDIVRKAKGNPPLREELLSNYATKTELVALRGEITHQMVELRTEMESRDRGLHKRINDLVNVTSETNRGIGELSGLIKGLHPGINN